jgi:hypothetical protein
MPRNGGHSRVTQMWPRRQDPGAERLSIHGLVRIGARVSATVKIDDVPFPRSSPPEPTQGVGFLLRRLRVVHVGFGRASSLFQTLYDTRQGAAAPENPSRLADSFG